MCGHLVRWMHGRVPIRVGDPCKSPGFRDEAEFKPGFDLEIVVVLVEEDPVAAGQAKLCRAGADIGAVVL